MSPYAYELSSEPIVHQTEDMLKVALMNYISQNYRSEILHDKMLELEELVCPLSIF